MIERVWVIPMMILIVVNSGLMVFNSVLPDDSKLPGIDPVFNDYYSDIDLDNGSNSIATGDADITGSSFIDRSDKDSQNVGIDNDQAIFSASSLWSIGNNLLFGWANVLTALLLPEELVTILLLPFKIIVTLLFFYVGTYAIGSLTGIFR